MEDKLLPSNLDAEQHVLQSCFVPGGIDKASRILKPEDFSSIGVQLIYSRMLEFYKAGRKFNIMQIEQSFEGHPDQEGISRILDEMRPFTHEDVSHYSRIVKESSIRRKAIKAFYQAHKNLFDVSVSVKEITERLREELDKLDAEGNSHE